MLKSSGDTNELRPFIVEKGFEKELYPRLKPPSITASN
jgi:hypothetical protein